ncbi:hypothetical protein KDA14_03080, partial [Candidatus Saccharibacteria bacterium]|nr:hypothetical protein [Candidatus Saccharibacteria bacterium]
PQFLEAESNPDATLASSFGKAALHLVREAPAGDETRTAKLAVLGYLPDAVEAQHNLDTMLEQTIRGEKVDRVERESWVKQMIPFNNALKGLLTVDRSFTTDDVTDLAESTVRQMYLEPETADYAIGFTKRRAGSMLHEIITLDVLQTLEGVEEILPTTIEDDVAGIDIRVLYKGKIVNLDIKGSKRGEVVAKRKGYIAGNVVPLWTGLKTNNLNGSTIIDADAQAIVAGRLLTALESDETYQREQDVA